MNRSLLPLFFSLAVATSLAVAQPANSQMATVETHSQFTVDSPLKFQLFHGYAIVARGSSGRVKKLNLLIDTGTEPTIVDQRLAAKLKLSQERAVVALLNRRSAAQKTILPDLELGPVRTSNLPVLVQDLSFLQKWIGICIDAVIGFDALGKDSITIDYGRKEIRFGQSSDLPFSTPLRFAQGFATVEIELNGKTFSLLVDTGASSIMLFASKTSGRLPRFDFRGMEQSVNLAGRFNRRRVRVQSVRMGEMHAQAETAFLVDDQIDAGRDFDGLLSPIALGFTKVGFDLASGTLRWSR